MASDYQKLLEVGETFFSVKDADILLTMILKNVKDLCEAERSTIFIKEYNDRNEEVLRSFMATEIGGELKDIVVSSKKGIVGYTFQTGQVQLVKDVSKNAYFNSSIDEQTNYKTRSILSVPLLENVRKPIGVIQILNKKKGEFDEEDIRKVKLLSMLAVTAFLRIRERAQLARMKKLITDANQNDLAHISFQTNHLGLKDIYKQVDVVANSTSSVLLLGDSGTGKEVMARYIHSKSERSDSPFVVINCAAIPPTLFEAELFGIVSGVATGVSEREGVFQKDHVGTLFLDEIGELPFEMQSKLLRVLQEKKVARVGESEEKPVDVRLITATNRNLEEEIRKENVFREDLFFRINVFQFKLPSLQERMVDIEPLSVDLLKGIQNSQHLGGKSLSLEAFEKLKQYHWPGNIRELKNVLERACVLSEKRKIITENEILLPHERKKQGQNLVESFEPEDFSVTEMSIETKNFQKQYAQKVIDFFDGNKTKAAKSLKISREGLRKILKRKAS